MLSLVYVSSASHLMSNEELRQILQASRRNNEMHHVTGMLLYKGGSFMQVLEGPREEVLNIYEQIQADPRHGNILLLSMDEIGERQFADWKMGFADLDDESLKSESAYTEFMQDDFTADKYRKSPRLACVLLLRDELR